MSGYSSDSPHYNPQYYESYDKFLLCNNLKYFVTLFTAHGKNPHYQQWDAFLSEVNNERFLNIDYTYAPYIDGKYDRANETNGYFFVRLMKINTNYDSLTISVIADTTLKTLTSSKEVQKIIRKNLINPTFYKDTLHCYKVNGYHLDISESIKKAN